MTAPSPAVEVAKGPRARTLFDKIWHEHVVATLAPNVDLLHVDRHLLHDLSGTIALRELEKRELRVACPDLSFATPDHAVSSAPNRTAASSERSRDFAEGLRAGSDRWGIRLFDLGSDRQGIVHVIGPELGLSLPGSTIVCGDSHTCTHGGLGALAWGIGSSEVASVLATQAIIQRRPKRMRVRLDGSLDPRVSAKDLVLYMIGRLGAAAGSGHAVEFAGSAVRRLMVEQRLTLCNLTVEFGGKVGLVAPDDSTFEYLADRPFAPRDRAWEQAVRHWRSLPTDDDARFDAEFAIQADEVAPQVTWGTSVQDTVAVDGRVPDPSTLADPAARLTTEASLAYMGLEPGTRLQDLGIDWAFIGSCTNGRLSDLRDAAAVLKGRRVAPGVNAWVVPGSTAVKRQAEGEGLDRVFRDAGFEWRESGCSLCSAANGEVVGPGQRCVSTSNRNFVGRQGPGSRTHLASPATVAASAVMGRIADVRRLAGEVGGTTEALPVRLAG